MKLSEIIVEKLLNESGSDLDFIDTHWTKLIDIALKIKKELPVLGDQTSLKKISNNLSTIPYSNLDNWSKKDMKSEGLKALSDKIYTMILKGDSPNVKPMLMSIVKNTIKTLYKPGFGIRVNRSRESQGKGHFKWNERTYTLNNSEIDRLKEYFDL